MFKHTRTFNAFVYIAHDRLHAVARARLAVLGGCRVVAAPGASVLSSVT